MQRIHNLLDGRAEVPPMHVEYIYVRGAELVERRIHGHAKRFGMVPGVVDLVGDLVLTALEAGCILAGFQRPRPG